MTGRRAAIASASEGFRNARQGEYDIDQSNSVEGIRDITWESKIRRARPGTHLLLQALNPLRPRPDGVELQLGPAKAGHMGQMGEAVDPLLHPVAADEADFEPS